jgi:hypothetical protein
MKKILAMLIVAAGLSFVRAEIPPAKVDVQVVVLDQDGEPVSGANCIVSFDAPPPPPQTEGVLNISGTTDSNGVFAVSAQTRKDISCGVTKPGYYKTVEAHKFDINKMYDAFAAGKPLVEWQSDPVEMKVVLKKIIKPIPMYAYRVEAKILDRQPLGFDLVECDWVAPQGKGKIADFVFTSKRNIVDPKQWDGGLTLTFSNKGDGIQDILAPVEYGSELRLPHQAPENKYQSEWSLKTSAVKYAEPRAGQNYFFRVRTVLDEKGNVKSALYGKIHGDISYYIGVKAPEAGLGFTYYLNPTPNDRNVEFDVKRNLFTGLKGSQAIKNP